ncbi:MAG: MazG nucleotide pyrophosphohydrolase domain-containing protein, partial [Antricoccus sp.]
DVLLQVLFHARIAQEAVEPFGIDDIANTLADKLQRRHPHVFAAVSVAGSAEVEANWEAIKIAEQGRVGVYDGLLTAQSALSLAAAALRRADQRGVSMTVTGESTEAAYGAELLEVVRRASADGVDAEFALRQVLISAISTN